ncbi:MAG: hypothetical protein V4458_06475, partial [Pseudomonadota bacterium]
MKISVGEHQRQIPAGLFKHGSGGLSAHALNDVEIAFLENQADEFPLELIVFDNQHSLFQSVSHEPSLFNEETGYEERQCIKAGEVRLVLRNQISSVTFSSAKRATPLRYIVKQSVDHVTKAFAQKHRKMTPDQERRVRDEVSDFVAKLL